MTTQAQLNRAGGARLFRLPATSGLITGVSAAGVLFAWRNPGFFQRFSEIRVKWRTVTGFTAGQEMAIALHLVSSFDETNYTGGTDLSDPDSDPAYIRCDQGFGASLANERTKSHLVSGNVRIATTAALSHAGSPTIQSQPFLWDAVTELATGDTVHKGRAELVFAPNDQRELPVDEDGGFVVLAPIAMGAAGTGRLSVEVCWHEYG